MKPRQNPARRPKKQIEPKRYRQQKETCSDSEDDVSFEEVAPFSPMCNGSNTTDEENFASEDDKKDSVDEEHARKTRSGKRSKMKRSTRPNISKQSSKVDKKQKKSDQLPPEPISVSDIELIIDKAHMATFKEALRQLPTHLAQEYYRYLQALQDKFSSTRNENMSKPRYSVLYSKPKVTSSNNCTICSIELGSPTELRKHVIAEHQTPKGFICTPCDKFFKSLALFNHHVTYFHSTNHQCQYCNLSFQRLSHLNKHLLAVHSCKHKFVCTLCDKGFAKVFQLMMHLNVHTGLTPHKCEHCPKAYSTSDSLREHARCHNKEVQFECDKCDKVFHTQKLLNVHVLTHGSERKFVCSLCEKAFKTPQNLVHHRKSHGKSQHVLFGKAERDEKTESGKGVKGNGKTKRGKHVISQNVKSVKKAVNGENVALQDNDVNAESVSEGEVDQETVDEENVISRVNTEAVLDTTEIDDINSQPLNLKKTIFGDFKMDSDSDSDSSEDVYKHL